MAPRARRHQNKPVHSFSVHSSSVYSFSVPPP